MKKIISLLFITIIFLSFIVAIPKETKAYGDLDYIELYEIYVDPVKEDGSLDIRFNIEWRVLDSISDGPLTWVKIGIPNKFVRDLVIISSSIDDMYYYSDSGSYIRLDLDRSYNAGELVHLEFKYNQYRMYQVFGDTILYDYNPGYFEDIKVKECNLYWNKSGVKNIWQSYEELNDYYKWSTSLSYSEVIKVDVNYDISYFNKIDEKLDYSDSYMVTKDYLFMIFVILLFLAAFLLPPIIAYLKGDPYMRNRGFVRSYYPYRYYRSGVNTVDRKGAVIVNPSNGTHSGSGGGCACACACACAGGGRAGCSKKDFYKDKKKINI